MADISYLLNEEMEDSEDSVEDEDEEEDEMGDKGGDEFGGGQLLMPFEQLLQNTGSQTTFNRQMVGRILLEYFKSAVESNSELNVDEVFNTVQQIVSDPEPSVRLDLVEQLPHVVIMCQETPHLFGDVVSRYILGIILKYLRDCDNQVRQTAQAALIAIVERGILSKKQLEFEICPVILKMTYMQIEFLNTAIIAVDRGSSIGGNSLNAIQSSNWLWRVAFDIHITAIFDELGCRSSHQFQNSGRVAEAKEEKLKEEKSFRRLYAWRMTLGLYKGKIDCSTRQSGCDVVSRLISQPALMSGTLISKLGPYMGSELVERVLLDRYLTLCEDDTFFVRKVCASYLGEICAAISKPVVYKKLLPKYVNLCMDGIWGVRKACVDVMLSVASCVTIYEYRLVLSKLLATQLNDESKWVRTPAYQILGPFISIFASQFSGLRYNQFGDFVMSHNQGSVMRQNIVPSTKNESVVSPNDIFATPLEREIGVLGIDMYVSNKGEVPSPVKKKNVYFPLSDWLGEIAESEEQTDGSSDGSGDDANKFNPFQYYYIPPEMPLDLELIKPSDKTSSDDVGEVFEEVFDDVFSETLTEDKAQVLSKDCWIQETKPPAQTADENIVSNREPSDESSSLESSNLSNGKTEKVENSNIEQIETKLIPPVIQDFGEVSLEEEPMIQSEDKEENFECYNNRPRILDTLDDTIDVSNVSCNFETNQFSIPEFTSNEESTDEIVPQFLIDYFVSMVDPSPMTDIEPEIYYQCAFYFPAVVMTLGKKNWHQLKNAYQILAAARQWKVRFTVASSIHEVALILGEELASSDLVPIYNGFFKDLDEVRIGALKHLNTFLRVLRPADIQQYLPKLSDFLVTDNEWNWRFREEFARQLVKVVTLYECEDVSEHISPLVLQLLEDKVAAVRQVAVSLVAIITSYLRKEKPLVTALIQELRDLLILSKWTSRQTYALVCSQLIRDRAITTEIFSKEILPYLLNLSEDRVPNVRLAVARTLATDVVPIASDWLEVELMEAVVHKVKKLHNDPDRDVRVLAGGSEVIEQNLKDGYLLDAF